MGGVILVAKPLLVHDHLRATRTFRGPRQQAWEEIWLALVAYLYCVEGCACKDKELAKELGIACSGFAASRSVRAAEDDEKDAAEGNENSQGFTEGAALS